MWKGKPKTLVAINGLAVILLIAYSTSLYTGTPLGPTLIGGSSGQGSEQATEQGQGTLRVTVVTPSGQGVTGAELSVGHEGEPPDLKARTGRDGNYLSPQLAAGIYQLNVVSDCYHPWHGSLRVEPGKDQAIEVTLKPSDAAPCSGHTRQLDMEVQFSDSTALKPGGVSGAVDGGGYSSQAQGTQMRAALGEWAGSAASSTDIDEESNVLGRGNSLLLQGDYGRAISFFQQATAHNPRSARLLLGLGVAYYSAARYRDALDALCKAVDLDPSQRATYFFLAQTYTASPLNTDGVLSRFERYSKSEPRDAAAQYYYALCLWRSGAAQRNPTDADRVGQALHSAVALDPSLADAHFQLGIVLAEQRQDAQALAEFERVIALEPAFAEAHYRAAQIYQGTGQKEKAQAELDEYEQLRKRSASGDQKLREDVRKLLLGSKEPPGDK